MSRGRRRTSSSRPASACSSSSTVPGRPRCASRVLERGYRGAPSRRVLRKPPSAGLCGNRAGPRRAPRSRGAMPCRAGACSPCALARSSEERRAGRLLVLGRLGPGSVRSASSRRRASRSWPAGLALALRQGGHFGPCAALYGLAVPHCCCRAEGRPRSCSPGCVLRARSAAGGSRLECSCTECSARIRTDER